MELPLPSAVTNGCAKPDFRHQQKQIQGRSGNWEDQECAGCCMSMEMQPWNTAQQGKLLLAAANPLVLLFPFHITESQDH